MVFGYGSRSSFFYLDELSGKIVIFKIIFLSLLFELQFSGKFIK